jgi:hypothetical protein
LLLSDLANDQEACLAGCPGWHLKQIGITPEALGLQEVDAVLGEVGRTLVGVELKVHTT